MRLITKIVSLITIAVCLCLPVGVFKPATAAGTARMYLSPSSGSAVKGGTITADVHVDSGTTKFYGVNIALSYPTSSLTWISYTPASNFPYVTANKASNGIAQLEETNDGSGVTGDTVVATVKFSVTAGSGTANLALNPADSTNKLNPNASSVKTTTPGVQSYDEILSTTTGSSYSLSGDPPPAAPTSSPTPSSPSSAPAASAPAATAQPKPSGSSSSSSSSSSPSQPAAAAPALAISGVSLTELGPNSVTVSWQTNIAANSIVDYGLSTNYIATATDGAMVKDHKVTLSSLTLVPNTTFHFRVKSVDANNNVVQGQDTTFITPAAGAKASNGLKKSDITTLLTAAGIGLIVIVGLAIGHKYYVRMQSAHRDMEFHFPKLPTTPAAPSEAKPVTPPTPTQVTNSAITSSGAPGTTIKPVSAEVAAAPVVVATHPKIPAKFEAKPQPKPSTIIKPAVKPAVASTKAAATTPPKVTSTPADLQSTPTKVNNVKSRLSFKKLK